MSTLFNTAKFTGTHKYRIDGKFAHKAYSLKVDSIKKAYQNKIKLMFAYFEAFSCIDNEKLTKENECLKSEKKRLQQKYDEVCKINENLRAKLVNFAEIDKITDLI